MKINDSNIEDIIPGVVWNVVWASINEGVEDCIWKSIREPLMDCVWSISQLVWETMDEKEN